MALGNFFDRNVVAAHQILGDISRDALEGLLEGEIVGLAVDDGAAASLEGRRTAELAANLLSRFYPRLSFTNLGTRTDTKEFVIRLEKRSQAINPDVELEAGGARRMLVVGDSPLGSSVDTVVYLGSDGWHLRLSTATPVGSSSGSNPFGAGAAACLGVANIFRAIMADRLPGSELDHDVDVSVVDWGAPVDGMEPPDLDSCTVDLSETLVGGVGAIGSATVWTLARVPKLQGTLRVIDPDAVELSNLQRYVLTEQSSVGTIKVEIAADELRRFHADTLEVTEHPRLWGEYLAERGNWDIPRLATAFDTERARIHAQGALPRSLLNAWTQLGDLGVSRHTHFGEAPCVACLYAPQAGGKSEAEQVANDLGFEGAPHEIRELLYTGASLTRDFVLRVASNLNICDAEELDVLLRYTGLSLREFHRETVCGGVMLDLGVQPGEHPVHVPMAFQSTLAGIMLAAEIVMDAARREVNLSYVGPTRTVLDLLRSLPAHPHPPVARREGCICSDIDYLRAYREKYEDRTPTRERGTPSAVDAPPAY